MQNAAEFVKLYEAQYPRVTSYARRRVGRLADAEDCAAEVFRLAWERPSTPDVGWLFVTAKNIIYASHRADVRFVDLSRRLANEADLDRSDPVADHDRSAMLEALDRLPPDDREILMAFYWDDLSGAECARLLGCSTAAIWVRLHRARRQLRTILQQNQVESGSPDTSPDIVTQIPRGQSLRPTVHNTYTPAFAGTEPGETA
ncbi:MAG: sigma-70 family RNA polymerase sigma factor [Propionibacteriaceae bacterium]|jgi:RNA polymerase sigma-70 factor (ECF subfamily)|nr:sigma-70 family RNA polymerase sigma factor [Propionibacteriaceae bacterium]